MNKTDRDLFVGWLDDDIDKINKMVDQLRLIRTEKTASTVDLYDIDFELSNIIYDISVIKNRLEHLEYKQMTYIATEG